MNAGTVRLPRELWARLEALTRELGAHSVRELVVATVEVMAGEGGAPLREGVRARLRAGAGSR